MSLYTPLTVRPIRFVYCAALALCAFAWGGWPGALFVLLASIDVETP